MLPSPMKPTVPSLSAEKSRWQGPCDKNSLREATLRCRLADAAVPAPRIKPRRNILPATLASLAALSALQWPGQGERENWPGRRPRPRRAPREEFRTGFARPICCCSACETVDLSTKSCARTRTPTAEIGRVAQNAFISFLDRLTLDHGSDSHVAQCSREGVQVRGHVHQPCQEAKVRLTL